MKYIIVILIGVVLGTIFWGRQQWDNGSQYSKSSQSKIELRDATQSQYDRLLTVKAKGLMNQQDSVIEGLKLQLKREKHNSIRLRSLAQREYFLNNALQLQFDSLKTLKHCELLLEGLACEISTKDSLIDTLDQELCNHETVQKALRLQVEMQNELISSKEKLIVEKNTVIAYHKSQEMKNAFWDDVKIKIVGVAMLVESVLLMVK